MGYKVNCACYFGKNKIIHATLLSNVDKVMASGVAIIKDNCADVELYKNSDCTVSMKSTIQRVLSEMLYGMDIQQINMLEV